MRCVIVQVPRRWVRRLVFHADAAAADAIEVIGGITRAAAAVVGDRVVI